MLYKSMLGILALTALGLVVVRVPSPSALTSPGAAATSTIDFDRAFANFTTPSDKSTLASQKTQREMLRQAGMARANSAKNGDHYILLQTRVVDSPVPMSLYGVDEKLFDRELGAAITLVLSDLETPLVPFQPGEAQQARPVSARLAGIAPVFEPSPASSFQE